MMRAAILSLVLLSACSSGVREELPPPQMPQRAGVDPIVAARAAGVAFRAVGEAPDFVLQIYRENTITLAWDNGANQETFPKPEPIFPRWNGEIYATRNERHTLTIEVRHTPCDAGNGEMALASVRILIDGEERRGCGRAL